MPPERHERRGGKKKSLQGETPGESRDELKARTTAQKQEQQVQSQSSTTSSFATPSVHHMSTRQKAQSKSETPAGKRGRTPSPSHSSSNESSGSSPSSSSPAKGEQDEQEVQEVPVEQPTAPEPLSEEPKTVKPPSQFLKLARRLSQKTPVDPTEQPVKEAQRAKEIPVSASKAVREASEMPPSDLPRPRDLESPLGPQLEKPESGTSNYE